MYEISPHLNAGNVVPSGRALPRTSHVETRVIVLPASLSRTEARAMLADEAEYGKWELARLVRYSGGARKVWLRRRVINVSSSGLI
jgi:hypothetical protein